MASIKKQKTCAQGHPYFKSSNCPICPICEGQSKPHDGFLASLSAPARRALESQGISKLDQLANYTEKEILQLHGLGKASIPKLQKALAEKGLAFK